MLSNELLTPALLLAFPNFFAKSASSTCYNGLRQGLTCACCRRHKSGSRGDKSHHRRSTGLLQDYSNRTDQGDGNDSEPSPTATRLDIGQSRLLSDSVHVRAHTLG